MKNKTTIALLIIIAILLGLNYCEKPVVKKNLTTQINVDSIRAIESEVYELKLLAATQEKGTVIYRDRWHKAKPQFDTIPCDTALKLCISICDTLIVKDSLLIGTQKKVINKLDSALNGWKLVHSIDSAKIQNSRERQLFFIGCDVTTKGNIYPSLGFDTRKMQFIAGYDPFDKSVKVGAYFKIKAWKRR